MGDLPVGHPARAVTGRAVAVALAVGAAFAVLTWTVKELPALNREAPWQDDPYDAVVSLALWCVPLVGAACGPRLLLCRRRRPLPARRAVDLVRTCGVLLVVAAATEASAWVSVARGEHRPAWGAATGAEVAGLAVLTVATTVALAAVRRARRALPADPGPSPDWLADAVAAARRLTAGLGRWRPVAGRLLAWVDRRPVAAVRRRPLLAAAAFAAAFGVAVDTPQVVIERYRPGLALLFFAVSACSVFAFLAVAGASLNLVERRPGPPGRATAVAVAAAACVPLAVTFRNSLWWAVGTDAAAAGLAQLAALTAVAAAAGGALAAAGLPLVIRRRP